MCNLCLFTKDESECSQAILNITKEARDSNLNIRDSLRKIGATSLATREVSSQECVYTDACLNFRYEEFSEKQFL